MLLNPASEEFIDLAAIFDMDGVIAHTNPFHAKAFAAFFDRHCVPYSAEAFEQHMYGKHNSYIMSHFFNRKIDGDELLTLEAEKEGLFREIYAEHAAPLPYLPEFLQDLKANAFRLGVATSAPRANMDLVLDTLSLRHYFDSTLSSEDVTEHKPHPEVYLKSAKNLQMAPDRCLVFEDSFSGITAGQRAGMQVLGVLTSHTSEELPQCVHYLADYRDLSANKLYELFSNHVG